METITALFGGIATGFSRLFDLASMAVGVPPAGIPLSDAAVSAIANGDAACGASEYARVRVEADTDLSFAMRDNLGFGEFSVIGHTKP